MNLKAPFKITSRLLPGVRVGGAEISIDIGGVSDDNRDVYTYYIDGPAWSHSASDLKSGCGGGSIQDGMESLLDFLGAAGESFRYAGMEGENSDLFPRAVVEWAAQNSDELTMLRLEMEEAGELISDE